MRMIEFVLISFNSKMITFNPSMKVSSTKKDDTIPRDELASENLKQQQQQPQQKCCICSRYFVNKYTLRDHIEAQHQGKRHCCAICQQQLKYKSALTHHIKHTHGMIRAVNVCILLYSFNLSVDMCMRKYRQFIATKSDISSSA